MTLQLSSGLGRLTVEFLHHTQLDTHTHTQACASPDEGSGRRRDLYMTTNNTHKRHTTTPLVGVVVRLAASEWAQTQALDHAAIGKGTDKT